MGDAAVRTAVYNAHWDTLGGGEQLAGGMAAALARRHDVELLVREPFDAIVASERLGFDLTGFPQLEVPLGTRAFLELSERYDLLANTSFSSCFPSRAARSLYYVHFPIPNDLASPGATERWRWLTPVPLRSWIERVDGFWLPEFPAGGTWTRGTAHIDLVIPAGVVAPLRFDLSAHAWPPGRLPHVRATLGDEVLHDGTVGRKRTRVHAVVTGRGSASPLTVKITSDTFVPRIAVGNDDDRELGVIVSHVYLGRRFPSALPRDTALMRSIPHAAAVHDFLDSYDAVVANSAYTARWIEKLWKRDATVIAPPVRPRAAGEKRRIILSVGRFFPNVSGHSKKQLELVEAFRIACAQGLTGWELHLAGGCSDEERGYVETVRQAAVGLPVRFHVNARGKDIAELFASATLFWHAAGLGEDAERHPDRFEHFGISVVEAMSAGAVPLVYAHGGPAAIVGDGACGVVYSTVAELAARTLALAADPDGIRRRADAAIERASEFSFDQFADHVLALVDRLGVHPSPAIEERA
jgi:glycosyltransferase involved in cell wall biosynthesis